ncbi:histidine/lysine/arginine/ornithine ABC transporter permease HisQ [Advenella kashmirensis W13003]|uniref:Histidine/lysine/arginine/ornithine ABC transporter permease HisQ n=1 Tax=Advenella kashmirensis W13003 TaxID=1424334 RepID=V8QQ34_9BURK|nr:ABC transporter permease subunit [Advenella kashmirensis]ETF01430.1 histidine/lysine/arginine/ornithine ABC transporter permease HisQ [Advenella kashmirensis W13003]
MLYGYGSQIWAGTLATCLLTVLTLLFSIIIGMIGALCKLSPNPLLRWPFTAYTTLIRSVPDLVIMLLVFYNLQELINFICAWAGWAQYQMDAFSAGVTTLSFIYGAYMTETFRGAIQSVPKGQLEAGYATGMSPLTVFRLILLPQLIRFALPGLNNNLQVIIKATALVSIIGLLDIVTVTQQAGRSTQQLFFFNLVAAGIYLCMTAVSLIVLSWLDRRYSAGVREVRL